MNVEIPPGTAAKIQTGEIPDAVPAKLVLRVGDTLVVNNLDLVWHQVGSTIVAPRNSSSIAVTGAFFSTTALLCTFHPAGALPVIPRARPGLFVMIPVTLASAIPLGLAAVCALYVIGRLDPSEGPGSKPRSGDGADGSSGRAPPAATGLAGPPSSSSSQLK